MRTLIIAAALFLLPASAGAATLYFSPSSGAQAAGKAFTVNVYASSPDQAMNAVSADIAVDGMFTVVSASSVGSVVNFWVEQPSVSGSTVSFEGVVLNPGYQGSGAKIASIILMPKKAGTGAVSFSSASVLANDGQGTEILASAGSASFAVSEAAPAPAPAKAPQEEAEEPEEAQEEPEEMDAPPSPLVSERDETVAEDGRPAFKGVAGAGDAVEFLVYKDGILVATEQVQADDLGNFSALLSARLAPGEYEVRVRAVRDGAASEEAGPFPLLVKRSPLSFGFLTSELAALAALASLAVIALVAVLHAYGFRRLFKVANEIAARHEASADVTARVFDLLKKDLAAHVRKMRDAGEDRVLTKEELEFLADFEDELAEAEEVIAKKKRPRAKKPR